MGGGGCGRRHDHRPGLLAVPGLQCRPFLHQREIFYHQQAGILAGRFDPHRNVEATEICRGSGRYLTVGHIDHGSLLSAEYYRANGEHLTADLPGNALVSHIVLITTSGTHLPAVETRHSWQAPAKPVTWRSPRWRRPLPGAGLRGPAQPRVVGGTPKVTPL